jgi:pilus assembly protein CpaC
MLRVIPSHVLLEVRVMEVSKSLTQRMEANPGGFQDNGDWRFAIADRPLTEALDARRTRASAMAADGDTPREWTKLLANPRVITLSGEEGGFVAGGKMLVPMQRTDAKAGVANVALDEKDFGVGLKLRPTVRRGGRISLTVSPESSALLGRSSFVAVEGGTAGVPTLATRRTHATFELDDGQILVIAGWFERSPFDAIERFAALGEVPILGAMLQSEHFQAGESELAVVVTPRILRRPALLGQTVPAGKATQPDRRELAAGIAARGDTPTRDTADGISHAATSAKGGFEVK